jgi:phosphonopyruvate decarboxylase
MKNGPRIRPGESNPNSAWLCQTLIDRRYELAVGVPCGYLADLITRLDNAGLYLAAPNEGSAAAIAAGAYLGGHRSVVILQNSGLGNLINPLTSLLIPFQIPILFFVSLRGWPDPEDDEPQHAVMGRSTHALLDACGVPHWTLGVDRESQREAFELADKAVEGEESAFLLVPRDVLGRPTHGSCPAARWTRREALDLLLPHLEEALIVATTGFTSRSLFALDDRIKSFYMQGSMGHAMAMGLGVSMAAPEEKVVVLDGDGAAMMHMGTMATIGQVAPPQLLHVVIDNGSYESTGGQPTPTRHVDWVHLAEALGYAHGQVVEDSAGLERAFTAMAQRRGPHLLVLSVDADAGVVPPRASSRHDLPFLRARFQDALR